MRIVVFGYHDIGCAALQTLRDMGHDVCAVFTHEDDPGENRWFGSMRECASDLKIPTYAPENPNAPEWIQKVRDIQPDLLFSFYYRKMLSPALLEIPPMGALNLHGSLLPKYRGRAPVNWVLVHGEKETGLTLHYMVQKPDAGDIVAQRKVEISEDDTALTLYRKLVPLVGRMLRETMPLLAAGHAPRIPQDHSQATYFGGRKPADGRIDWTRSSEEIYNLVRAVTHPYPGAFGLYEGKKVLIWKCRKSSSDRDSSPGTILNKNPLTAACGSGAVEIERIQTENETEMDGTAWAGENIAAAEKKFE